MVISKHAIKRCQQRGIPYSIIDLIVQMVTPLRKPGGATEYCINKKDKNELQDQLKKYIHDIDKIDGDAVLMIEDNVVTVYHKKR